MSVHNTSDTYWVTLFYMIELTSYNESQQDLMGCIVEFIRHHKNHLNFTPSLIKWATENPLDDSIIAYILNP